MPLWLFFFLAALATIAGLGVVVQRNPIHCVLALAVAIIALGILFMGLGAETIGFLQIIVYVGAIMVLFVFVIWLLNIQADQRVTGGGVALKLAGAIGAAILAAEFATIIVHLHEPTPAAVPASYGTVASLAMMLFSNYLIAFEVTSILLLAAIAGAIALARRAPASTAEAGGIPSGETTGDAVRRSA